MFGLRPPGFEFRIPCLEGSVISPSSGGSLDPIKPVCAQKWHKARFISFGYLLKGDRSVLIKRLASDSETVPKPNVLLVDHIKHFVDYMYGERQE